MKSSTGLLTIFTILLLFVISQLCLPVLAQTSEAASPTKATSQSPPPPPPSPTPPPSTSEQPKPQQTSTPPPNPPPTQQSPSPSSPPPSSPNQSPTSSQDTPNSGSATSPTAQNTGNLPSLSSPSVVFVTSTSTQQPGGTNSLSGIATSGASGTPGSSASDSGPSSSKTLIVSGAVVGGVVILAGVGIFLFRFSKNRYDWDDEGEVTLGGRTAFNSGDPFKSTLDQYHRAH